jgi:chromosome segregation ATPase
MFNALISFLQDEITEMKRKLKIMNHQIDQLKEEISSKEAALVKENLEHHRVEKEKEALKAELQRMKQQAEDSKAYIEAQEAEERKLLKIIAEADAERVRQKKELDQVRDCSARTPPFQARGPCDIPCVWALAITIVGIERLTLQENNYS